jgi:cellulose synthase/poly-beta-1,6-N-acetylglucosamine synthase-like glycosyltransferase
LFFGLITVFWLTYGIRSAYGALRLPWLKDFPPAEDNACPRISLLFAARDEEEKLPIALSTLEEIDYPNLEIIAVDDRSTDATGRILDEFAAKHPRLRAVHVASLPEGWLGKPHALERGYEQSRGEWLLFTDADVRFRADTLRRAVSLAEERKLDHLTLLCDVEMIGFWEKTLITFFGFGFQLAANPAGASNPRSRSYAGIGAFQLVRRSAYEASGTHRRLALEVVDDMKLGKIVKQAGFRSEAAVAQDYLIVRWHAGFGNLVRGVTKNFFAAAGFRLDMVLAQLLGLFCLDILPWAAIPFVRGWMLVLAGVSVCVALIYHAGVAAVMRVSPLYALTHPVGAAVFSYMLGRSTVVTLWRGGVTWRDTFYPLEILRKGSV